jgi:hypothetical protein
MSVSRSKHELKACPRCGQVFECKLNNPVHCHCAGLQLSEETLCAIRERFRDCLCLACLTALAAGADLTLTGSGGIAPTPNPVS